MFDSFDHSEYIAYNMYLQGIGMCQHQGDNKNSNYRTNTTEMTSNNTTTTTTTDPA
jgi:hypothetical protein